MRPMHDLLKKKAQLWNGTVRYILRNLGNMYLEREAVITNGLSR